MKKVRFEILTVKMAVDSDDGGAIEGFAEEFAAFEAGHGAPWAKADMEVVVRLHSGVPRVEFGERVSPLDACPHPGRYVGTLLRQELADALSEFHMLHASAAATGSGVLVVAGPSGAGKSTLVRALVGGGMGYYADDICPLNRRTRLVHPFPTAAKSRSGGREKESAPASSLGFDPASQPLPAAAVVVLDTGVGRASGPVEVFFRSGADERAWDDLPETSGVRRSLIDREARRWRIDVAETAAAVTAVGRWLKANRGRLWTAYRHPGGPPDFGGEPRLERIPASEAARLLLRETTGGVGGELAAFPSRGTPGEAWVGLAGALSDTPCYRMGVGRLGEEVGLLRGCL